MEHGRRERWKRRLGVVMRGMQVRMRALLQVVVAWACAGVTGLVRARPRRGPVGGGDSPRG